MAPFSTSESKAIAIDALGLVVAASGGRAPLLGPLDFALRAGECVLVRGPTGSGKSTLLRALAGVRGASVLEGRVARRGRAALLLQRIDSQLLCASVGEEVAFGPRRAGERDAAVRARVRTSLERVGLSGFEARRTDALSAGEKQRVAIAALLALDPAILLLDEPSSALDAPSRARLDRALVELKRAGCALVVADHAPNTLPNAVDRVVAIEGTRLVAGADLEPVALASPSRLAAAASSVLPLRSGERVLVAGANGAGKTTLLRELAQREAKRARVALALQDPRRQLFARTVEAELAFGLARAGLAAREVRARTAQLLERFDLAHAADRSPLRLSFGQQHRLAIAASLAARPAVVLLDEPFAGLDPRARAELWRAIESEIDEASAALVVASHDREPLARVCDRVVELARALDGEHATAHSERAADAIRGRRG